MSEQPTKLKEITKLDMAKMRIQMWFEDNKAVVIEKTATVVGAVIGLAVAGVIAAKVGQPVQDDGMIVESDEYVEEPCGEE